MPSVLVCPECGAPLPPGRLICSACGATASPGVATPDSPGDEIPPEELAAADAALAGELNRDENAEEQTESSAPLEPDAPAEPGQPEVEPEQPEAPAGPEPEPAKAEPEPPEPEAAAREPFEPAQSVPEPVEASAHGDPAPDQPAAEAPDERPGVATMPDAGLDPLPQAPAVPRTPGGYLPPSARPAAPYIAPRLAAYETVPEAAAPFAAAPAGASWAVQRASAGAIPGVPSPMPEPAQAGGPAAAPASAAATATLREFGTFGLVAAGGSLALISLFLPWASETGVVIGLLPAYKPEKWGWAAPVAIPMLLVTLAVVGLATLADRYEDRFGRAAHAVNRIHEVVLPLLLSGIYFGIALVCVLQPFGYGTGVPVLLLASLLTFAGGAVALFVGDEPAA